MWQLMVPNYGTIRAAGAIPGEAIGSDWKLHAENELCATAPSGGNPDRGRRHEHQETTEVTERRPITRELIAWSKEELTIPTSMFADDADPYALGWTPVYKDTFCSQCDGSRKLFAQGNYIGPCPACEGNE